MWSFPSTGIAQSCGHSVFTFLGKRVIVQTCNSVYLTLQWLPQVLRMKQRFPTCVIEIFYDPGPACISSLPFYHSLLLPNPKHTGLLPHLKSARLLGAEKKWISTCKRMRPNPSLYTKINSKYNSKWSSQCTQINSQCIKDLRVRPVLANRKKT